MPSQGQKITIDKFQLTELTKQAEKGQLCEGELLHVLVENGNLKHRLKIAEDQLEAANELTAKLKQQRNLLRLIVFGALAIVGLYFGFKLFKPSWM